ncbi:MAG: cyclase family protein [Anaerolineae bacterium]
MTVYDISLPIHPHMAVWPGDPEVSVTRVSDPQAGGGSSVSRLELGTHTGTHVDAPSHILLGSQGVDALPLEALIGQAHVAACDAPQQISAADLAELNLPLTCTRLLLKTRNSAQRLLHGAAIPMDYCALTPDAGQWLAERGLVLVGIDAPSVEGYAQGAGPVHETLLHHGVVVVEGLDLHDVPPGIYTLCCLPLRLTGADGAPARVVLLDQCD